MRSDRNESIETISVTKNQLLLCFILVCAVTVSTANMAKWFQSALDFPNGYPPALFMEDVRNLMNSADPDDVEISRRATRRMTLLYPPGSNANPLREYLESNGFSIIRRGAPHFDYQASAFISGFLGGINGVTQQWAIVWNESNGSISNIRSSVVHSRNRGS